MGKFLSELPPDDKDVKQKPAFKHEPRTNPQEPQVPSRDRNYRMSNGETVECDCGTIEVTRMGDKYTVKGPAYNLQNFWLKCADCDDAIAIAPKVEWV